MALYRIFPKTASVRYTSIWYWQPSRSGKIERCQTMTPLCDNPQPYSCGVTRIILVRHRMKNVCEVRYESVFAVSVLCPSMCVFGPLSEFVCSSCRHVFCFCPPCGPCGTRTGHGFLPLFPIFFVPSRETSMWWLCRTAEPARSTMGQLFPFNYGY